MSIRTIAFFLFLIACVFGNSMQAGSEEGIEASPASPSSSPNHQQSPIAAAESVMPTTPKKLSPRSATKIPKHIDEKPISLRHKKMISMYDKTEQNKARWEAKPAKAASREKAKKMTRTDPSRYTPYPRKRH